MRLNAWIFLIIASLAGLSGLAIAQDSKTPIETLKTVGKLGNANEKARQAWKALIGQGPEVLPEICKGFDTDPIGRNWLRLAAETIADKADDDGKALPIKELETFVKNTSNPPAGRRLAYDLLLRKDKGTADRFLPGMLQDPSSELRRDAVARVVDEAEKLLKAEKKQDALQTFRKALTGACDQDQVDRIAEALKGLGEKVDLARHFGFVRTWRLVGPFDNKDAAHFNTVNPPETKVDLQATYPNKENPKAQSTWESYTSDDPYGMMDLNRLYEPWKAVTAYAVAEIDSPKEQKIEIRLGSANAFKVFLNGKEILGHEEYHHGMRVDQYAAPAVLREGKNELLVKVCQNEKKQPWEKEWQFQLRLCDSVGAAIPFTQPALPSQLTIKPKQAEKN